MADLERLAGPDHAPKRHVIFIHGLDGDVRETWRSRSPENISGSGWRGLLSFFGAKPAPKQTSGELWPKWLASDIDNLAVWSVGFPAAVSKWAGEAMFLTARAANVYERLLAEEELADGELIFVGHSFGGLVIKQLLRKASDEAQSNGRADAGKLVERTRKVAFLATPHNGADLAVWADRLRLLSRPSETVISLAKNDPGLRDLNQWYRGWAGARDIDHLILVENEATHGVVVVTPDSADPGLSQSPTPIDADHISIAKPDRRDNEIYVHVRKFITRAATTYVSPETRAIERVGDDTQAILKQQHADSARLDELLALARQSGAFQRASEQGVSEASLRAIVERLGGLGLAREDLVPWLDKWITEVTRERAIGSNEGEAFERAFEKAKALFDAGRLDEASAPFMAELARRREAEKIRLEENRRQDLRLVEEAIEFDKRAFNGAAAAAKLRIMAEIEGAKTPDEFGAYLYKKARAFVETGDQKGDNAALLIAVAALRESLIYYTRDRVRFQWAMTQNDLGNVLATLGARESGAARLEEAVAAHREAMKERERIEVPLDWAMTQNNLGNALATLGERESGTERLEEAVAAFRNALKEFSRERSPLQWAGTQNNLGAALRLLGERESGTVRLKEAVAAFSDALKEYRRERLPLKWAMTQNNLGNALATLGERESGTERLEEAVAAFRKALKEYRRERVPHQWAGTQKNLGHALTALGVRGSGTARLEEALVAYRDALREHRRERVPLPWAMSYGNQGFTLMQIAKSKRDITLAAQAIEQIEEAYEFCLMGDHAQSTKNFKSKLVEAKAALDRLKRSS